MLERLTFWQLAIFHVVVAWVLGGATNQLWLPMVLWGLVGGGALTIWGVVRRRNLGRPLQWPLWWALPAVLLATWVLVSSFNPSFTVINFYEQLVYRPTEPIAWLPSSAVPTETRHELLLMFAIFLSAFNLALNLERREPIKTLFMVIGLNAMLIAVVGTLQKLSNAEGILWFFDSPNPQFFGTFIYHNHWGAYALMITAVLVGLSLWFLEERAPRGFTHSPGMLTFVGAVLVLVAIPVSSSRSCTALAVMFLLFAAAHFAWRLRRQKRLTWQASMSLVTLTTAVLFAGFFVAERVILQRLRATHEQFVLAPPDKRYLKGREIVYSDTLRMIADKPIAGWGLQSFYLVHKRYSTVPRGDDGKAQVYEATHSDWLQTAAETGLFGLALALASFLTPQVWVRRRLHSDQVAVFARVGCVLVLGLALVEFPLQNPAVCLLFATCLFGGSRIALLSPVHRRRRSSSTA